MVIGKARERRRARDAKRPERDPGSTDAYENGWYLVLARQAAGGDAGRPGDGDAPTRIDAGSSADDDPTEGGERLASVTTLALPPGPPEVSDAAGPPSLSGDDAADHASVPAATFVRGAAPLMRRRPSHEPTPVRIGVRRLADPDATYLAYLTGSPHDGFFRRDWWHAPRAIVPLHLWRANHLGADWRSSSVQRFMEVAAKRADQLVASAPAREPAGSATRRAWFERLATSDWVAEFGIGAVSKALHALLPELVPDLDPTMITWARREWLGLHRDAGDDDPERWMETWELLEDVLVLRGEQLAGVSRRVRSRAPGAAPTGRLGVVLAAFWESYRREVEEPGADGGVRATEPTDPPRRRRGPAKRAGSGRGTAAKASRQPKNPRT